MPLTIWRRENTWPKTVLGIANYWSMQGHLDLMGSHIQASDSWQAVTIAIPQLKRRILLCVQSERDPKGPFIALYTLKIYINSFSVNNLMIFFTRKYLKSRKLCSVRINQQKIILYRNVENNCLITCLMINLVRKINIWILFYGKRHNHSKFALIYPKSMICCFPYLLMHKSLWLHL